MSTENFILKNYFGEISLLIINDLEQKKFTIQDLFEAEDCWDKEGVYTDSLQAVITPSDIVIAAADEKWEE
jgi:hypothetical protein